MADPAAASLPAPVLRTQHLAVHGGGRAIIEAVSFAVPGRSVTGILGPSGVGKSTLLRCLNRLVDLTPGLRVSGQVFFHGQPVYAPGVDADALRARIGMLFQQPVIFPGSILANVLFGVRHLGVVARKEWPLIAKQALTAAALWEEVKDRLSQPAQRLSVGQQQRLCLARTLAVKPEVILMDEPTSALDPASTEAIEALILQLKTRHALVLVTHNHTQAERVCDHLIHMQVVDGAGRVI